MADPYVLYVSHTLVVAVQERLPQMRFLSFSLLVLAAVTPLSAADLSTQTVDGLGRPVPGVQVEISCMSPKRETIVLQFKSDENGMVYGTYDTALCTPSGASIEKEGYQSYFSGFRSQYVLRRQLSAQEVLRVAELDGASQERELRELLAGDFSGARDQFEDVVFSYEARLRPALRNLARDPLVTKRARDLLSLIAAPEDLHLIMQLAPPPQDSGFPERWRWALATALVNPDGEDEWSFLRWCALNEFNDRWVDAGAIQALKLTASPRSQRILEEAQQQNQFRARSIAGALDYIRSNPPILADTDLESLARRVADVIKIGTWKGNGSPRLNQAGEKALVDFNYQTSEDILVYTATFHKMDGAWILRGAHETYQAFAPALGPIPVRK